jgi:hypothetical protein
MRVCCNSFFGSFRSAVIFVSDAYRRFLIDSAGAVAKSLRIRISFASDLLEQICRLTLLEDKMVSDFQAEETLRRDVCTDGIVVDVDRRLYAEAVSCFPINGVNYQTANLNGECIKIVWAFTLSALRDESRCFSFSQKILDHMDMIGSRKRKQLVSYLQHSSFFKVVAEHSKGHHCKIRQLCGVRLGHSDAYQHNTVRRGRPWGGGRGLEYGSGGLKAESMKRRTSVDAESQKLIDKLNELKQDFEGESL